MLRTKHLFANVFVILSILVLPPNLATNIALGKPAYQSSVYTNFHACPMDASKAVDGNRNSEVYACHCSHINDIPGDPNWWAVDLLGVYTMDYVVVYNRNSASERLNDFWIGFTNVDVSQSHPQRGHYPLCGQYPGKMTLGVVGTVKCNYNLPPARYLIIQMDLYALDGKGMCICELEAFPLERDSGTVWTIKSEAKLLGFSQYDWNYKKSVYECILQCISTKCDSFNENPDQKTCIFNIHLYGFNRTSIESTVGWKFWSATHA